MRRTLACLALALLALPALAHRLSPAYFGLTETAPDTFEAQWKVSISGGLADALSPKIPEECAVRGEVRRYTVGDALVQHGTLECPQGIAGRTLTIGGLESTDTDVLVRVAYLDGSSFTHRLVPDATSVVIPERAGTLDVMGTYFVLGVEHILLGIDHLLFVLALLLLVSGFGRLVATITAFTVAHSITLGAATLGVVNVPSAPVEATIALSILFLATELARNVNGHGRTGGPAGAGSSTLTGRYPWLVAFAFGLLHGFGFAGALSEVGLPQHAIPLALLFFNVGVEAGQILFVAAVLGLISALRRAAIATPRGWTRITAYGIGSLAAFWVFERTAAVFA